MDAVLVKAASAKDNLIRLTVDIPRDNLTVDIFDYIDKPVDIRIPNEKE